MFKWFQRTPPEVGSVWVLRGEASNPFTMDYHVVVDEVKLGWVKYRWYWARKCSVFYGSYQSIRNFRAMYKELK